MTDVETRSYRLIKMHLMRLHAATAGLVIAVFGVACTSAGYRAPIEERGRVAGTAPAQPASTPEAVRALPPGSENAGKPGYATVKAGDTLIRVAIDAGQNWRDVAKWNAIESPYALQVGQVLRVTPPADVAVTARAVTAPRIEVKPLDAKPGTGTPGTSPAASTPLPAPGSTITPPTASTPAVPATSSTKPATPPVAGEAIAWAWPAVGAIGSNFEEPRNKGIAILGKLGDPITASAFGRVIYGGALRGYGTIVLIKHNESYMSVYGNLRTVLVREGQVVTKGQRIAEMGNSESERVQVHFEIRRDGEAIDPMRLLPAAR